MFMLKWVNLANSMLTCVIVVELVFKKRYFP